MTVRVIREGKRWAIVVDGRIVEGGFFTRGSAERWADEYRKDGGR